MFSLSSPLLLAFLLVITTAVLPQECFTSLVDSQTCSWYPLCLDQKYDCGKTGYPIGYGYKYCNKFGQLKTFPQARLWIEATTVCLKQRLTPTLAEDKSMSCHDLRNTAFATHPLCYEQAGFCKLWKELGYEDSAIFLKQLVGIFQVKDFESAAAIKQVEDMVKLCAEGNVIFQ